MPKKKTPAVSASAVALDLGSSLQARRSKSSSWESAQGEHRRRYTEALGKDVSSAAESLAHDVSTALAAHVDDLSTYHHDFRVGMSRVFVRVLRLAQGRKEQVALFNEAVPGFTLLLFKKDPSGWTPENGAAPDDLDVASPAPELSAASQVIAQFVQRTGDRVLTVETDDALFVFFPASDVKKNLKEMGFYYTD